MCKNLFRLGPTRLNIFLEALLTAYVFASYSAPALAEIPQSEREALIAIYTSMGGDGWTNRTGWLNPPGSECSWYGVACDAAQTTVTGLDLSNNSLNGAIPADVAGLAGLQLLDLSSPGLTGSLPPELGALRQLRSLRLTCNGVGGAGLSGNIPAELGNLRNLETLVLSRNQLSGSIPAALGDLSILIYLDLNNNQLSGGIPSSLANLRVRGISLGAIS